MAKVEFVKVNDRACLPVRSTNGAAGYDLTSCEDVVIGAHSQRMISTGLVMQMNMEDCYARVAPRSGLAAKNGIDVLAGVIDKDYRGVIQVILYNHGEHDVTIKSGDRIAQLIFERIYLPSVVETNAEKVADTDRGAGGFGSTGA